MQTPTLPVAAAYPWAAWPAPCSWRTRMWRIVESISGSYAGRMAPPGMPKMFSVPAASSDLIRLCAPVHLLAHLILSSSFDRQLFVHQQKTPRPPGQRGDDALAGVGCQPARRVHTRMSWRMRTPYRLGSPPVSHSATRPRIRDGGPSIRCSQAPPALPGADARLVALGVGEHPERGACSSLTSVPPAASAAAIRALAPLGRHQMSRWKRWRGSSCGVGLLEPERRGSGRPGRSPRRRRSCVVQPEHGRPERPDRRVSRRVSSASSSTLTASSGRRAHRAAAAISLIRRASRRSRWVTPPTSWLTSRTSSTGSAGRGRDGGSSPRPPRRSR